MVINLNISANFCIPWYFYVSNMQVRLLWGVFDGLCVCFQCLNYFLFRCVNVNVVIFLKIHKLMLLVHFWFLVHMGCIIGNVLLLYQFNICPYHASSTTLCFVVFVYDKSSYVGVITFFCSHEWFLRYCVHTGMGYPLLVIMYSILNFPDGVVGSIHSVDTLCLQCITLRWNIFECLDGSLCFVYLIFYGW